MKTSPMLRVLLTAAFAICGAVPSARAGLMLHWKLDESTGLTAADSSGNAADGTWQGTVGTPAWVSGGIDGGAFQFTGLNRDSIIVEGFNTIPATPFTISVWMNTASTENDGVAYLGNGSGSSYYVMRLAGNLPRVSARNTAEIQGAGFTAVNNSQWHHVAAVYAGDEERRLYVDGRLEATNTTFVLPLTPSRFGIGALTRNTPYNPADLYTGLLDDAAVWDRAFTETDAAALNGLGVLRAGNASDLDPFVSAFASQGTVNIRGRQWAYAPAVGSVIGETGGSLVGLDAYIVLDPEGNGMRMTAAPGKPVVVNFAASPPGIFLGATSTLSWEAADAESVSISPGIGPVANPSGSVVVTPTAATTYTLTATNSQGSTTAMTSVTVNPDPVITSFTAAPSALFMGDSTVLSWNADNFVSLKIEPDVGTVTGMAGSVTLTPTATTTYTLTATNANSTLTAEVTVSLLERAQPVVHWTLDATDGLTAPDSVAAHDGMILGEAVSAPGEGVLGDALQCDGFDDAVRLEASPVTSYPFVLSGWVNTFETTRQITAYLGDGTVGNVYYAIGVSGGNAYLTARNATLFLESTGPALNDGQWHQLVGVFESGTRRTLYLDGMSVTTQTQSFPFSETLDRFSAGRLDRSTPADHTFGRIDDIGLWAGALRASDVTLLHTFGLQGGTVSDFGSLLLGFTTESSASAVGFTWTYATGLSGVAGDLGGSISGGDAYLVFDENGNGMRQSGILPAPPAFTDIRINPDKIIQLTWSSIPDKFYRIDYARSLGAWQVATPSYPSGGGSTSFLYTPALGPDPATEPRLFFKATLLP